MLRLRTPIDVAFQGNTSQNGGIRSVGRSSPDINRKPGASVQISEGKGVSPQLYRRSLPPWADPPLGHFMVVTNQLETICSLTLLGSHISVTGLSVSLCTDQTCFQWFVAHLATTERAALSPVDRFFSSQGSGSPFSFIQEFILSLHQQIIISVPNAMLNPRETLTGNNSQLGDATVLFSSWGQWRGGGFSPWHQDCPENNLLKVTRPVWFGESSCIIYNP